MPATLFVEFGLEALRQPGHFAFLRNVAPRTGRAGGTAGAGMLAFPWPSRMAFTHPAAVLAQRAFHACRAYPDFCHESPLMFESAMPKGCADGLVGPDVCRPVDNVARRAPSSRPKSGRTSAPFRPQAWQVNRGSMSESRRSSGHWSTLPPEEGARPLILIGRVFLLVAPFENVSGPFRDHIGLKGAVPRGAQIRAE